MDDVISRQAAISILRNMYPRKPMFPWLVKDWQQKYEPYIRDEAKIRKLPSAQPETCEGCKHLGKWENEVECGYPSPCTCCKRRVEDRYER